MKIILNGFFIIILLGSNVARSQFVNKGEMAILVKTVLSTKFDFNNTTAATLTNDGDFRVFAAFNNDGIVTFSPERGGVTNFQGLTTQVISGNSISDFSKFNNVVFDNKSAQPPFQLSGDISISGTSDFLNGIVKINESSGAIVYENKAGHLNVHDGSHVDGYVERKGKDEFEFPIGNESYFRMAKIIPVATKNETIGKYVGKYFLENSDVLYPHSSRAGNLQSINDREYWTIENYTQAAKTNNNSFIVSLSWNETTTPDFIWRDLETSKSNDEMISVVRWDKEQKMWVDEGGIVEIGANGTGSGTVTSFSRASGDGIFTLARGKKKVETIGNIVVYNAVSANGDGKNDYFKIDGIQNYPNNRITIFNRWGVKVFETTNYDSNGNIFKGYSEGRTTINVDGKLPTGTYFYILEYQMKEGDAHKNIEKAGYLYLNDN